MSRPTERTTLIWQQSLWSRCGLRFSRSESFDQNSSIKEALNEPVIEALFWLISNLIYFGRFQNIASRNSTNWFHFILFKWDFWLLFFAAHSVIVFHLLLKCGCQLSWSFIRVYNSIVYFHIHNRSKCEKIIRPPSTVAQKSDVLYSECFLYIYKNIKVHTGWRVLSIRINVIWEQI